MRPAEWPRTVVLLVALSVGSLATGALAMRASRDARWRRCLLLCDQFQSVPVQVGLHHCQCELRDGTVIELREPRRPPE